MACRLDKCLTDSSRFSSRCFWAAAKLSALLWIWRESSTIVACTLASSADWTSSDGLIATPEAVEASIKY